MGKFDFSYQPYQALVTVLQSKTLSIQIPKQKMMQIKF